jgi:hypothetical protein
MTLLNATYDRLHRGRTHKRDFEMFFMDDRDVVVVVIVSSVVVARLCILDTYYLLNVILVYFSCHSNHLGCAWHEAHSCAGVYDGSFHDCSELLCFITCPPVPGIP